MSPYLKKINKSNFKNILFEKISIKNISADDTWLPWEILPHAVHQKRQIQWTETYIKIKNNLEHLQMNPWIIPNCPTYSVKYAVLLPAKIPHLLGGHSS